MPTSLFEELASEKKERILNVGIAEFAQYGYTNSSTNRIVKGCGISKGSLFQYFESKEKLYLYILDSVTSELMSNLNDSVATLSKDPFKKVIEYSRLEFSWYVQNPEKYKIIMDAFLKNDNDIYPKIEAQYGSAGDEIYYKLLKDTDPQGFRWDRQKTVDILKWVLKGFNEEFIRRNEVENKYKIDELEQEYVQELSTYMEVLKAGLLH